MRLCVHETARTREGKALVFEAQREGQGTRNTHRTTGCAYQSPVSLSLSMGSLSVGARGPFVCERGSAAHCVPASPAARHLALAFACARPHRHPRLNQASLPFFFTPMLQLILPPNELTFASRDKHSGFARRRRIVQLDHALSVAWAHTRKCLCGGETSGPHWWEAGTWADACGCSR